MKIRIMEFSIGVFFFMSIISFLLLIFQISGLRNVYKNEFNYKLNALFSNVGNLKINSKITIGGVKVGKIIDIRLEERVNARYLPIIEIEINGNIRIPIDSSISILTCGLLGDNYLNIEIGYDTDFFKDGDIITLTTPAISLEDLIAKFTVDGTTNFKMNV